MIADRIASAAAIVSDAYVAACIPQPLLRDRTTIRVPARAIGAGIEAASVGARSGTFERRVDQPGFDLDITSCYAVANALAGAQDLLTHTVSAHHGTSARNIAALTQQVRHSVRMGPLDHPEVWRPLAYLVKVRPQGDVLTAHVDLMGTEATVTTQIAAGSRAFWTTGFDLAVAIIEDLDAGGDGRVPEIVETWSFECAERLPGLHPVAFPGGWTWDPRRPASYRSRDGRTWGHLPLLLSAMRLRSKEDPDLTPAARIRRAGALKIATVSASFGMFSATTQRDDVRSAAPHHVITADGIVTLPEGQAERPGPWAFPQAAALVEGAGRLLLTLLIHEVRVRGGSMVQVDTDGGFISATLGGSVEGAGL